MSCTELQEEEVEVLRSIYDGDENFKEISNTCFQYKVCSEEESKSFLLEIVWTENYPVDPPLMNLNAFYNKHLIPEVKEFIISRLTEEADLLLGTAMTYTLFEWAKENNKELTSAQPDVIQQIINGIEEETIEDKNQEQPSAKKDKKPKLSKQQKRRLANRMDVNGELPRGWNWVDVVKHLSQTSSKPVAASSYFNSS